jgi:hypothetical protein
VKLLERNILSIEQRLVLLAPPEGHLPAAFDNLAIDVTRRRALLQDIQRLRGAVYLNDGAVRPEDLSADGRHETPEDETSWHLLTLDRQGRVNACVWYLVHENTASLDDLRARHCPLRRVREWRHLVQKAIEADMCRARRARLHYAEVGGWAVAEESRRTSEGLLLALAAYSLGRLLGGALGITTATVRHASSTILRRLGGAHLAVDGTTVPPYYDPHYDCEMELLRFDSRQPSARYAPLVEWLEHKLAQVSVLAAPACPGFDRRSYAGAAPDVAAA